LPDRKKTSSSDHENKESAMKIFTSALAISALCAINAWAVDQQMLSGSISDSMCKVNHSGMPKKMTDRDCTRACAAKGAQYVLVSDGKVYRLTNHDAELKTHAGHTVNLTGNVNGDTIRVSKIEMPSGGK
jgi:hypothetical protein